ncbi:MAG: TIGR00341 family protein [Candidatus Amulumruptor caecigallinarius]|nr:TIGR00341 family protein [Candidatus Amulumruptor caecigallinarius]MCM1396190.1 TIGR00341 family protein [Candidatus Amulumruptor caecigallinarius]MCM1453810.1 TIGR00341 family protein [bacterium]
MQQLLQKFITDVKSYFNISNDLEQRDAVLESVRAGVSFKGSQLLVLIFAIFIASVGLNTNSIPVIIGAMLISPLMGPIIGMGVAIAIEDFALLRRSLRNVSMAVVGSLLASAIYFLIWPQYESASQLLARTSPSIYDVFVGLFGGAAGILSIACKNKGQVMPGVAIATSLMPPLCTAGYGLATVQMNFFLGALYLFVINAVFILFASWVGVKVMGYRTLPNSDSPRASRVRFAVYTVVCLTVGMSIWMTVGMFRKNIFLAKASDFVNTEMVFPNTQVLSHKEYVKHGKRYIDVNLIGAALPKDSLQLAMLNKLDSAGLGGTVLNITQGFTMDKAEVKSDLDYNRFFQLTQQQIASSQQEIDSLRAVIQLHSEYTTQALKIAPEVKVLFPAVKDIALSRMLAAPTTGSRPDTLDLLLVNAPSGLKPADRTKLTEYARVRLSQPQLKLVVNPGGIPWPQK